MIKHNPNNERIKRKYLIFLKEAKRQNESSIDAVAKALSRFESYTKCRDFKAFHFEQALEARGWSARQASMKAVGTPELIRDMRRGRSPSVQRFRAPFRAGAQMEPMRGCRSSTVTLSPPKPPRALRVPNPADPGINRTIRAPESAQDRRARPDPYSLVPHDLRSPWDRSGALVLESEGASTMG